MLRLGRQPTRFGSEQGRALCGGFLAAFCCIPGWRNGSLLWFCIVGCYRFVFGVLDFASLLCFRRAVLAADLLGLMWCSVSIPPSKVRRARRPMALRPQGGMGRRLGLFVHASCWFDESEKCPRGHGRCRSIATFDKTCVWLCCSLRAGCFAPRTQNNQPFRGTDPTRLQTLSQLLAVGIRVRLRHRRARASS